jgi:superfamily II DNA or RNA helicase
VLIITSPTKMRFVGYTEADRTRLGQHLKYIDRSVDFELRRLKKSGHQWGYSDKWEARIAELTAQRQGSLLFEDEEGFWTYPGLAKKMARLLNDEVETKVVYPAPKRLPWASPDTRKPYEYQSGAKDNLLEARHGSVEIATGLGKSLIILHLAKELGLKTVIMAPTTSIAKQLLKEFTQFLGKKYVGQYFGGKKEPKKNFIVAVANSLTLVEEGSEHWDLLRQTQVFIADESHQCAAKTLAEVCHRLFDQVPYRFFFSATQLRADGLALLLEGIIGPVVHSKTLREGVDEGYLAKPIFTVIETNSSSNYESQDVNKMTREHLFYNEKVNAIAGDLANNFCAQGKQVLILIDEVEQFAYLLPHLRHKVGFAHGPLTKDNKGKVAPEHQESDPSDLVAQFNAGNLPILVGTSCISCGTDVKNNKATINLQGGKSEVAVRQGAIGRSTRKQASINKTSCHIIDFDVQNVEIVHKHALEREQIYDQEYGPVRRIAYGKPS